MMGGSMGITVGQLEAIKSEYLHKIEDLNAGKSSSTDEKIDKADDIKQIQEIIYGIEAEIALKEKLSRATATSTTAGDWRAIEVHIVMSEAGAFVVDADADEAAQKADEEFPDDEMRQISLTLEFRPPSVAPEPRSYRMQFDDDPAT